MQNCSFLRSLDSHDLLRLDETKSRNRNKKKILTSLFLTKWRKCDQSNLSSSIQCKKKRRLLLLLFFFSLLQKKRNLVPEETILMADIFF